MINFIDLKTQYAALKTDIDRRIQAVLDHGQFIMGPEVGELEARLAAFTGAKHCVTVASGTEALLISLMALDIKLGDEIVTSPFTFAATVEVIALLGAKPVFVDIEPDTCNLDVRALADAIGPRTRAIMPVSLYGQPCDMDEINAIADAHRLPVIEDAAQSFGAGYKGRRSCNLSSIGCTSFFPSKPLGCYGDGGALFTNDDAIAQAAREIRVHGQSKRYVHTRIGVGGRMDTLQCAVVLGKLQRFEWELQQRAAIGARYDALIDAAGIGRVKVRADRTSVFAQYTVFVDDRARVQRELQAQGIPTAIHYPTPLHLQPAYRESSPPALPASEAAAACVMSLPMHPDLEASVQSRIVRVLAECVHAGTQDGGINPRQADAVAARVM
jgi:UDP-2-acetamido-2-deoxy-ribo-hexuluronate aminotransferase